EILDVDRRRLQDHLELVKLLRAVRILSVAPVRRAARGLDESRVPRLGAERAQERGRVVRARADLGVVRLHDDAPAFGPEFLQRQNDVLEVHGPMSNTKAGTATTMCLSRARQRRAGRALDARYSSQALSGDANFDDWWL